MSYRYVVSAFVLVTIVSGNLVVNTGHFLQVKAEAQGLQLRVSAAERLEFGNTFFGSQIVQIVIDDPGATDSDDSTVGLQVKGTAVPRVHLRDGLWYSFIAERAAFLLLSDLLSDGTADDNIAIQATNTATPTGFSVTDVADDASFIRDITTVGTNLFIEVDQDMLFPSLPTPFIDAANPDVSIADDPAAEDGDGTCDAASEINVVDSECDWPYIRLFDLIETDVVAIRAGSASIDLTFDDFPDSITSSIDRPATYPVDAEVVVQFTDYMWNMNPVEEDVVTFVLDKDTGIPSRIVYQPIRNFPDDNFDGDPDNDTIANANFNDVFIDIDFDGRQVLELDVPEGIGSIGFTYFFDANPDEVDFGQVGDDAIETFADDPDFTAVTAETIDELDDEDDPAIRMIESDPNTSFFESIDEAEGSRSNIFTAANDKVASFDYFDIINSTPMTQHDGFSTVDKEIYNSADRAVFTVTDPDQNLRSRISETLDARESKNFFNIGNPIPLINTRQPSITPNDDIFDIDLGNVLRIWEVGAGVTKDEGDSTVNGIDTAEGNGHFIRFDADDDGDITDEFDGADPNDETYEVGVADIEIVDDDGAGGAGACDIDDDTDVDVACPFIGDTQENDFSAIRFTPEADTEAVIIDTSLTLSDIASLAVDSREMTIGELLAQIRIDNIQDGTDTDDLADIDDAIEDQVENFLINIARIMVTEGDTDTVNEDACGDLAEGDVLGRTDLGASTSLIDLVDDDEDCADTIVEVDIPKYNLIQLDTNAMTFDGTPAQFLVQIQVILDDCIPADTDDDGLISDETAFDDDTNAFDADLDDDGTEELDACVAGVLTNADDVAGEDNQRVGATQLVDFTLTAADTAAAPDASPDTDATIGSALTGTTLDDDAYTGLTDLLTADASTGYDRDSLGSRAGIGSFRVLDLVDVLADPDNDGDTSDAIDPDDTFIRFTLLPLDATDQPVEITDDPQTLVLDILGLSMLFDPPSTEDNSDAAELDREGTFSNMIYRVELDEAGENSSIFSASADFQTVTQFDTIQDVLSEIVTIGDPVKTWLPNRFIPPNRLAFTYIDEDIVNFFRSTSATFIYETMDGKIEWDQDWYRPQKRAILTLEDEDLNRRPDAVERYTFPLAGFIFIELGDDRVDDTCAKGVTACFLSHADASLQETGPDTGIFRAQVDMPPRLRLADGTIVNTNRDDMEITYIDIRDRSSVRQEFDDTTNVRTGIGKVMLDRNVYPQGPGTSSSESLLGAIMYISIQKGFFAQDPEIRNVFDLTTTVDFSEESGEPNDIRDIFEIKIFNGGGNDPIVYSANPASSIINGGEAFPLLDRNSNEVTQALESGPNTNLYELEFMIYCPDAIPELQELLTEPVCTDTLFDTPSFKTNSPIQVTFNDPQDDSGTPEAIDAFAVIQATTASLGSDKPAYHLGEPVIFWIADPDRNLDSKATDLIPFSELLVTTDKVEELPLDFLLLALKLLGEFSTEHENFRETDFNSGIFAIEAPEGVVDETVISRGSTAELIFFDDSPAGGGDRIRIEYDIPILEVKPEIIFDKEEYTPFDEVKISIISPDSNDEPFQINIVDVTVSSSSQPGLATRIRETGLNTGIFEEEFVLTPNEDFLDGDLVAQREDGLTVEFRIDEDTVVSKSVFVNYHVGNIMFDKDSFSIDDRGIVRVIDPDENKNPDTIDTITIRLWSTTDRGGLNIILRETGDRTGIFEEYITFTRDEESTGTRLRVSDGDTITAKYTDKTLPPPASLDSDNVFTVEVEEIFASALIGASQPLERTLVSEPALVDQNGLPIEQVEVDQQALIQSEVTNNQNIKQKFAYIVQVKDSDGVTISLSWVSGELPAKDVIIAAQSWIPEKTGRYEIEVFVWENIDNPVALSPTRTVSVTIS